MSEQGRGDRDRNKISQSGESGGASSKITSKMKVEAAAEVPEKTDARELYEHRRKELRLTTAREALRWTFGIITGALFIAFVTLFVFDFFDKKIEIFASPVLSVVFSGLFGTLTLILGFIAGSNIND